MHRARKVKVFVCMFAAKLVIILTAFQMVLIEGVRLFSGSVTSFRYDGDPEISLDDDEERRPLH